MRGCLFWNGDDEFGAGLSLFFGPFDGDAAFVHCCDRFGDGVVKKADIFDVDLGSPTAESDILDQFFSISAANTIYHRAI